MKSKLPLLNVDIISESLTAKRLGKMIMLYQSTESTNDIAWKYAKSDNYDGTVVFAEQQTEGRGRRDNKWLSEKSHSILCSFLLRRCNIEADMLTLATGVAVAEVVEKFISSGAKIKWPNDVMAGGKKIAGVLVEAKDSDVVIGIGLNCHQQVVDFDESIKDIATSIDIEAGSVCDRNEVARSLIVALENWLDIAGKEKDAVIDKWKQESFLLHKRVSVESDNEIYTGTCIGIDPNEGLILQLERGGVKMFHAAQATIADSV